MNILVLGGTQFVGRAITEELLRRGHQVTLFHRGQTGRDLFPECNHLLGDRTDNIDLATPQEWDAVVDVSCYTNKQATASTNLKTKHYVFISTISVYNIEGEEGPLNESTKLLEPIETEEVTGETYGRLKVRCEQILSEAFGEKLAIIRPGIVFGPHDPTGRFPYWVQRFDNAMEVLMIDQLEQPIQWIDVRDLANFAAHITESRSHGTWNAVGPKSTLNDLFNEIQTQVRRKAGYLKVKFDKLESIGLKPWSDLPLFYKYEQKLPIFDVDSTPAIQAGLNLRSMEETVSATLAWTREEPTKALGKYGMSREKELEAMDKVRYS
jgi:2'-hydroxyisoflavone reductase